MGGGPVPVSVVREALEHDAFLKAVIHDGVRIDTVVHYGRHIKAELRTALELGKPPDLDGVTCADGCGRRYNLEWDHVDPVANNGPTSFDNLEPRCWAHHQDKTERDRLAGLLDGLRKAVAGARAESAAGPGASSGPGTEAGSGAGVGSGPSEAGSGAESGVGAGSELTPGAGSGATSRATSGATSRAGAGSEPTSKGSGAGPPGGRWPP